MLTASATKFVNKSAIILAASSQLLLAQVPCAVALGLDWKVQAVQGEKYLESQDIEADEKCMRQALKLAKKDKSSTQLEIASCMQNLAAVLQMENNTHEVIPLYQKLVHLMERKYGRQSDKIVPALILLGSTYESEGDYDLAAKLYNRAVLCIQKNKKGNSLELADCLHRLGRASFESGLPTKAEENYRLALSMIMLEPEQSSSDLIAELLADYIDLFTKDRDRGKALVSSFQTNLLSDNLGKLDKTKGVGISLWNKEVSASLTNSNNSGRIQPAETNSSATSVKDNQPNESEEDRIFRQKKNLLSLSGTPTNGGADSLTLDKINKQRIDFYERMIGTDIDSMGPTHPSVARDLSGLATIYLLQNDYEKAKPLLNRALAIYKSVYSSDALLVRRTESLINLVSEKQDPALNSNSLGNEFIKDLVPIPLVAQKLEIVLKLNYLAFLNYSHGRINDARTIYAWALADTFLSCGEQSTLLASCLTDYSRVLASSGKNDEAIKMESNAQSILKREMAKEAAKSFP